MTDRRLQRCLQAMFLLLLMSAAASGSDVERVAYAGRSVADVIDSFRRAGVEFAYSTNLVSDDLIVRDEPAPGTPVEIVNQILQPYGLVIRTEADVHLVVRSKLAPRATATESAVAPAVPAIAAPLENVVVSASRYAISRDISASRFSIDQRTVQNLPDVGEDPVRVTQRLPGAAASGASAIAHFRGGELNETGIMLNGQWLFDPFHIRDFQNIFSVVDARAIQGVEVYTGGFPVRFGDRMSGLILMDSVGADDSQHSEIGLSVFNTSVLTVGSRDRASWLLSARRGNLDIVIDPKYGRPSYFDVFAEFAYEVSPTTRLSFNALFADDAVELVLETDPDERDQVSSNTRNAQLWARLDSRWSDALSSSTVVSLVDYSNRRLGQQDDEEKMVATVVDDRDVQQFGFRQDWLWNPSSQHWFQWGISGTAASADYNYSGSAEYFGLQAMIAGRPDTVSRALIASPEGGRYALYFSDRWKLSDNSIIEWGLRWDDQTYTDISSDSQLSPRLSYLRKLGARTDLRISVGRYFQSQPIQSLQVEDGISNFWPAQRADHIIVGGQHTFENGISLRLELFNKDIGRPRPRFENLFDPLGLMPELQQDRVRLDPQSAHARGVELSVASAGDGPSWWASYTWSRVTDRLDGTDYSRSWDQRHALQAGIDWQLQRWQFSAATSVHSGWPTTELYLQDDGLVLPGPRNASRHGTYASLDARISRRFDVRRGSLLLFFEVSNLTDRRNECCLDWDLEEGPGGEDVLERGQDFWMPMLPAVGLLWEF